MPNSFSSPARSFSMAAASPKPLSMMLAPSCASARAMARPIPEVEPVTSAVLPFSMAVLVSCGRQMACFAGGFGMGTGTCSYFCCSAIYIKRRLVMFSRFDRYRVTLETLKADRSLARKTQSRAVFPAPDHDHERCASDAIAHAEAICAARAERLTPIRRRVLEALLASHQPLGAYELIDRLALRGARPAPITIYRALDFLREQGLVHRIESRNAFIACVQNHASADPVVFLICEQCGTVGEAASAAVADTIRTASRAAGFTPKTPVIEISCICAHCK